LPYCKVCAAHLMIDCLQEPAMHYNLGEHILILTNTEIMLIKDTGAVIG